MRPFHRFALLVSGWLVASAAALAFIPPSNPVHQFPGHFAYQLADGGPDERGWVGKDPTTCNPSQQPGFEGFCNFCPGTPQCVGFDDSRIRQEMRGVSVVTVGAQQFFEFDVRYEFPNFYCAYNGTPDRPPQSLFAQRMWLSGNAQGTDIIGGVVAVAWFEMGFWKPRIGMDCTREFFYLTFQNCTSPTTIVTRTIGPFKLPSRRLVNGMCKLSDPQKCGMDGAPGPGVYGPINVGSGDVHYTERSLSIDGAPLGMDLFFSYASSQHRVGIFGQGWTSSFSQTLEAVPSTEGRLLRRITAENFDEYYTFDVGANAYFASSPGEIRGTITTESGGTVYALADLNNTVTRFEVPSGRWLSTTDRWGNALSADYSGMPNSFTVSDPQGRTLTFTLTGGRVTQIQDADSNIWRFEYSGDYLQKVFDPLHPSTTPWRTYEYFNYQPGFPDALSAVKDDADKIMEGHAYDSFGRATSSFAEGSRSFGTVQYNTPAAGQTTVTTQIDGALNNVTVFDVIHQASRFLPARINGTCAACGGGGGEDQRMTYDESNHLLSRIVGTGAEQVETKYSYDANGMMLARTEAFGKPEERTTAYAYGQANWPSFITFIVESSAAKPGENKVTTFSWNELETVLTTSVSGFLAPTDPSPTVHTTTTTFASRHRMLSVAGPRSGQLSSMTYYADMDTVVNRRSRLATASVQTVASPPTSLTTTYDDYDIFGTARNSPLKKSDFWHE